ncbi:MAG: hypothetical protein ABJQ69_03675 [Ekhidna sp.]
MLEVSNISDNQTHLNYMDLQISIDKVVGKIGLNKTIHLLEGFIDNSTMKVGGTSRAKVIAAYFISKSVEVFELNEKKFYSSREPKYSEARMACFHLVKKHTKYSYTNIGDAVGLKKRTILYYHNKCKDILSIAHFYQPFMEKYDLLENYAIDFISKLK